MSKTDWIITCVIVALVLVCLKIFTSIGCSERSPKAIRQVILANGGFETLVKTCAEVSPDCEPARFMETKDYERFPKVIAELRPQLIESHDGILYMQLSTGFCHRKLVVSQEINPNFDSEILPSPTKIIELTSRVFYVREG